MRHATRGWWVFGSGTLVAIVVGLALIVGPALIDGPLARRASAYVEARYTLAQFINESTTITLMKVEKVNKERKLIYYKKVADIKGTHPTDVVKHNMGVGGFNAREQTLPVEWAEPGKLALFFHNGGASETCLGKYWYQAYAGGEWWNHSHGEPYLARTFCGEVEALKEAVEKLLKNEEVVVPCTVSKTDLRIQKVRATMKEPLAFLVVEPPKIEKVALTDVAGFSDMIELPRPEGQIGGVTAVDFDHDGYNDLFLISSGGLRLLRNNRQGNFDDVTDKWGLITTSGGTGAAFADYNRSGKLSLLTSAGKLYTNLGDKFRDDSALLPKTPDRVANPGEAFAWLDFDNDGLPDIVASLGVRGLSAYRNTGGAGGTWFEDVSQKVGLGEQGLGLAASNYLSTLDLNGDLKPDFILNLSQSLVALNDQGVFRAAADTGISFPAIGKPVVAAADFLNEGKLGVFVTSATRTGAIADWQMVGTFSAEEVEALEADGTFSPKSRPEIKLGNSSWRWRPIRAKANGIVEIGRRFPSPNAAFAYTTVASEKGEKAILHLGSENGLTVWLNGKQVYEFAGQRPFTGEVDHVEIELKPGENGLLLKQFDEGPTWRTVTRISPAGIFPPPSVQLHVADGAGKFSDTILQAGDLAQLRADCASAAWGDINNDGWLDLIVTTKTGLLRVYLNQGSGKFHYAAAEVGLEQKFKAVGALASDFNRDGTLDLVLVNADPHPCVLVFSKLPGKHAPLTVQFAGPQSAIGARVELTDLAGKIVGTRWISGGDGLAQQTPAEARFAPPPGKYKVLVRYTSGAVQSREVEIAKQPVWLTIESTLSTAKAE